MQRCCDGGLVLAEHDNKTVKKATLNTVAAAQKLGADIHVLGRWATMRRRPRAQPPRWRV
jgi:hypothetical protein